MVIVRALSLLVVAVACSSRDAEQPASQPAGQPASVAVTLDQFRQLQWIAGKWRGSGGAIPSFYEEYRVLDDSTLEMRAFWDSTFTTATDSSWIEFRSGGIRSRSASRTYITTGIGPDSIRFAPPGPMTGGHTFLRKSADEWTATLHPSRAGAEPTVYVMRRVPR